jgi:nucleoid-associated protein YgaU
MWKSLLKRFNSTDSFVSLILGIAIVIVIGMLTVNYFTARRQVSEEQEQATEQEDQLVSLPTTHTVSAGESLWSIAERYYKSGYNWVELQKVNNLVNAGLIEVGQVLTIPDVPSIVPAGQIASASTETGPQRTYTVARGDHLWKIAVEQYGDGYKWTEIARANHLADPSIIHAGNVLTLP